MNTVLWIAQGVLALLFVMSGAMKLAKTREALAANPKMGWVNDVSPGFIKFIATAELAGALGMVLPGLIGVAPVLTPIAAIGLVVLMLGATATHIRRKETPFAGMTLAFAAIAAFVAYGRLGPAPLS